MDFNMNRKTGRKFNGTATKNEVKTTNKQQKSFLYETHNQVMVYSVT